MSNRRYQRSNFYYTKHSCYSRYFHMQSRIFVLRITSGKPNLWINRLSAM